MHSHQTEEPKARHEDTLQGGEPLPRLQVWVQVCMQVCAHILCLSSCLRGDLPYLQREALLHLSPFSLPHPPSECGKYFFFKIQDIANANSLLIFPLHCGVGARGQYLCAGGWSSIPTPLLGSPSPDSLTPSKD